jgi:tetratricopeptide (TPR) repeat protein
MDMDAQQDLDVNPFASSASDQWTQREEGAGETLAVNTGYRMKQTVSAIFFFLVVLLIVYAPSFSGAWIYDDESNILNNDNIHIDQINFTSLKKTFFLKPQDPTGAERVKRPLAYLSFALNWYVGKDHVFGYHVVNFIIHLTATVFLYLFIKGSLRLPRFDNRYRSLAHPVAFLSAMIWAVHPIQVTAVTYIVQRMASMAGMFTIVSLYAYFKARTAPTRGGRIACFSACAMSALCAFATKENSAMLPISLFFYEIIIIRGVDHIGWKNVVRLGGAALVMVILVGAIYIHPSSLFDGYAHRPYTSMERVLTQSRVVLGYLKPLFYPLLSELTLVHDVEVSTSLWSPWTTLPSMLLVPCIFLISLLWLSRSQPFAAFAIVFFFVNHAIEGSFVGLELIYEHRNYLPSMMLFFIPSMLFIKSLDYFSYHRKLQMAIVIGGAVVLATFGHSTYAYSDHFRNGLIFWRTNAMKSPRLSVVENNYGVELLKRGFNDTAFRTLAHAIELDRYFNLSQKGVVFQNLGVYYQTVENDCTRALPCFETAAGITLNSKNMWLSLSVCRLINADTDGAEAAVSNALKKWPDEADFLSLMASIQCLKGKIDSALAYARKARSASSGAAAPLAIFGKIYACRGDLKKAVFFWQAYRSKRPGSLVAALSLLELYDKTGDDDRLGRIVAGLMTAKGSRDWDGWLKAGLNREKYAGDVIDGPEPETILSAISYSLRRESEKAVKSR